MTLQEMSNMRNQIMASLVSVLSINKAKMCILVYFFGFCRPVLYCSGFPELLLVEIRDAYDIQRLKNNSNKQKMDNCTNVHSLPRER